VTGAGFGRLQLVNRKLANRFSSWAFAATTLAALTACVSAPVADPGLAAAPWVVGRLAVRVEASAELPARSASATFELRGSGQRGELRLLSPLGTGLATAVWAPGLATLSTPTGTTTFATLDELSQQALGEALPLAALPDWLAARPWPQAPHQLQDGGFQQLGWQVQTSRHAEGVVEARRTAPPAVWLRVKLD
jgi:outer membrane lipoprotein LolB